MKKNYILFIIITIGFLFRIFNINWDNGHIFHPDERAIIMAVEGIDYPESFSEFLSPESSFNPDFFAYGNFPMYLLKFTSESLSVINSSFGEYGGMYLVGRLINVLIDTGTILLVYLLSRRLFSEKIGIVSAFFYSVAVFPIQNSHFFTVDIGLTFFTLLTLLLLDQYVESPKPKFAVLSGLSFGLALATKISILPLALVVLVGFMFSHFKTYKKFSVKKIAKQFLNLVYLSGSTIIAFIVTQPYILIDFKNFFEQIRLQSTMGSDPFIFPYTLQYVGKIPMLYELKNIVLFGLGLPIGIFAILGVIYITIVSIRKYKSSHRIITLLIFLWLYFLLVSNFAVGWMRYLLPIYPILAIAAGLFLIKLLDLIRSELKLEKKSIYFKIIFALFLITSSIWTLSFMNIYINENTKIEASEWIHKNIERDKTLAVEHWDDRLPIFGSYKYNYETLPLYDPDTEFKWRNINMKLDNSDYIVIASNRLYMPLQRLTNCEVLPEGRCYPRTAKYYSDLFSGESEFERVKEFTSYPTIPIFDIEINDQSADESFTVYDHPKIMIFRKR